MASLCFDRILAVSDEQFCRLEELGSEKAILHRLKLPAISAEPSRSTREDLGLAPGCLVVTMIADWVSEKRPEDFLALAHCLRRHPEFQFVLIGEGPLASRLVDLSHYLGLKNLLLAPRSRPDGDWLAVTDVACTT